MEYLTINYLLDHSRFLSAALFLVQPLHSGWMNHWLKEQNATAGGAVGAAGAAPAELGRDLGLPARLRIQWDAPWDFLSSKRR